MTEIVGGPDIYVDRLSTLQLTCRWILCRMANVELLKGKCWDRDQNNNNNNDDNSNNDYCCDDYNGDKEQQNISLKTQFWWKWKCICNLLLLSPTDKLLFLQIHFLGKRRNKLFWPTLCRDLQFVPKWWTFCSIMSKIVKNAEKRIFYG